MGWQGDQDHHGHHREQRADQPGGSEADEPFEGQDRDPAGELGRPDAGVGGDRLARRVAALAEHRDEVEDQRREHEREADEAEHEQPEHRVHERRPDRRHRRSEARCVVFAWPRLSRPRSSRYGMPATNGSWITARSFSASRHPAGVTRNVGQRHEHGAGQATEQRDDDDRFAVVGAEHSGDDGERGVVEQSSPRRCRCRR